MYSDDIPIVHTRALNASAPIIGHSVSITWKETVQLNSLIWLGMRLIYILTQWFIWMYVLHSLPCALDSCRWGCMNNLARNSIRPFDWSWRYTLAAFPVLFVRLFVCVCSIFSRLFSFRALNFINIRSRLVSNELAIFWSILTLILYFQGALQRYGGIHW